MTEYLWTDELSFVCFLNNLLDMVEHVLLPSQKTVTSKHNTHLQSSALEEKNIFKIKCKTRMTHYYNSLLFCLINIKLQY